MNIQKLIKKMQDRGMNSKSIDLFIKYYKRLVDGDLGIIKESELNSVSYGSIKKSSEIKDFAEYGKKVLKKSAIIKLNGGLGTSMGLSAPKSFLPVKKNYRFIDIAVEQIRAFQKNSKVSVPLIFMNSAVTKDKSEEFMASQKDIHTSISTSFVHNSHPKILADNFDIANFPKNREMEWNPAGHGDIYISLYTSGILDELLKSGIEYAFISNVDNLGATLDTSLLGYFAKNDFPFMMEVVRRREMDKKGGHLAKDSDNNFVLRERAQADNREIKQFEDIDNYSYFNSNSIWINLTFLKELIDKTGNIELPLIANRKNINPTDINSEEVYQIETAMGSAISLFKGATAIEINQNRFRPVKKNNDLLLLWSDRFELDEFSNIVEAEGVTDSIDINLDDKTFRFYDDLRNAIKGEVPSLKECSSLNIEGNVAFGDGVVFKGNVSISNENSETLFIENQILGEING